MNYILHMSDFHFGKNQSLEKERLNSLASWILENKIHIEYLIFTGDMIDAPTVQSNCLQRIRKIEPEFAKTLKTITDNDNLLDYIRNKGETYVSLYDDCLKEATTYYMKQAGDVFANFIDTINVDRRKVVLCCGNHDRMRFAAEKKFECGDNHLIEEMSISDPFEAYDILCQTINKNLSYKTMTYQQGDINFIIVNSNWRLPSHKQTNNMCINCGELFNQLSKLRQSDTFDRNRNVLLVHKPDDDFCEDVKYPYAKEMLTLSQIIERTVTASFYGDKHSYSVKMNSIPKEFMCGLPLNYNGIRYNLLDFNPDIGINSCSYIIYDEYGWIKIPITDCIEKVYAKSKKHLKNYAFKLLTDFNDNNKSYYFENIIELLQNVYENGRLVQLSQLFASFSELRQNQKNININEEDIFTQIISVIENSTLQSVSIKGRPHVGKSTFLTITYLYMLWRFSIGRSRYIPFYFNVDTIVNSFTDEMLFSLDINKYILYCYEQFSVFLKECCELRDNYELPICVFVDGLEKSRMLAPGNNTIERKIYELLETKLKEDKDKYVMCFNTHDSYHFDSSFDKINHFDYVLFMNQIRIIQYKSKERKQNMFLSAYLTLQGRNVDDSTVDELKTRLIKFHKPSIDLSFLNYFSCSFSKIREDTSIWETLKEYLADLTNIADRMFKLRIDVAKKVAGLLFSQRKRFSEIIDICDEQKPTIKEFFDIINFPVIMHYLIANYYVEVLSDYSENSEKIPKENILFSFIPNNISILIRLLLDEKGEAANDILERFIDKHNFELKGYLYSTIVYLCGHLRTEDNSNLIKKLPLPDRESNEFFSLCGRRSFDLATAICNTNKFPVEDIILEFMNNKNYRKFNRSYQLHYYQDLSHNATCNRDEWNSDKSPMIGFDFRYSFLVLLSKLEPALKKSRPYPLMQLDLFTLCDLIYSRLQNMKPGALFYSARYNKKNDSECEAVLSRTIELLERYNRRYGGKRSVNDQIGAYFNFMETCFRNVSKKVISNSEKDVYTPYVSPCYDFERVLNLSSLARVGWNINTSGSIKTESQPAYGKGVETGGKAVTIKETLMEHIMESVYIAQLFLPDTLQESGYEKCKVIYLLLFSELGKINNGDFAPSYSNYNTCKKQEEKGLMDMLTLGALDGYANQPLFFQPLTAKSAAVDINMRICWEIKIIQTEFKYYTLYDELEFDDERRADFENDFEEPTTDICKKIREQLVLNNPKFKKFFD